MAVWQQIVAATSLTIAVTASRAAPQYMYNNSIWKSTLILFVVQTLAYYVYSIIVYPLYLSPLNKLPQAPGGSRLMGQFRTISRDPSGEPMKHWMETVPNEGLISYRTAFNAERVLVTNPKALAEVLTAKSYDFIKPWQLREGLGRILGVGVLLAEGDEHKRQRKNLNPAFAFRHVKDLYPVFWAKGVEMVQAMNQAISLAATSTLPEEAPISVEKTDTGASVATNIVEVGQWASRTTLDIIGLAGMGRDFHAIEDPSNNLYQTYNKIFRPSRAARILGIVSIFVPPWVLRSLPIRRNDDINEASKTIKDVAYDLIQNKKAKVEKGEAGDPDILSVALQSGGFSDEDLVNQLMTFLAAGHETTASSMTWAVLQLCKQPKIQDRLREDLKAAGVRSPLSADGEKQESITAADLEHVPYLWAFVNEVLRLNPPVPLTLRIARCDSTILGNLITKGTTVILCPLAVNLNTELWGPDAHEFNPDRWMAQGQANSGGAKSNYAFMTFLHGPRGCIGSNFAKAEFATLVAALISSFRTELEEPDRKIEIQGGITTRPKGGLRVKLTPVTK